MAFYKLNKFHFQVSDDEGWRIEIPELPELARPATDLFAFVGERWTLLIIRDAFLGVRRFGDFAERLTPQDFGPRSGPERCGPAWAGPRRREEGEGELPSRSLGLDEPRNVTESDSIRIWGAGAGLKSGEEPRRHLSRRPGQTLGSFVWQPIRREVVSIG